MVLIWKRVYEISRSLKYCIDNMRMSKHIFEFNFYYLDFLLKELLQISKEISDTFKGSLIKKTKSLWSTLFK